MSDYNDGAEEVIEQLEELAIAPDGTAVDVTVTETHLVPDLETVSSAGSSRRSSSSRRKRKIGDLDLATAKIAFLGAGKMTEAIVDGLLTHGGIQASQIFVAAPSSKNLAYFKDKGCKVTKRLIDVFGRYDCDIIFFCMHGHAIRKAIREGGRKPHALCTNWIPNMRHPIYFLSLVSGISLGELKSVLLNPEDPGKYKLEAHRIMLNTAVAQGFGLCGIDCDPDCKRLSPPIRQLLSMIAPTIEHVPESQMDALCAAGGAGLAFSYNFINALADGGVKIGLPRVLALKLASKTALSSARTLLESGKHPSELREEVTAPGGAAAYGLHTLDRAEVASGVAAALEAAYLRNKELAE